MSQEKKIKCAFCNRELTKDELIDLSGTMIVNTQFFNDYYDFNFLNCCNDCAPFYLEWIANYAKIHDILICDTKKIINGVNKIKSKNNDVKHFTNLKNKNN